MPEKLFVVFDRAHARVFELQEPTGPSPPNLTLIGAIDIPLGRSSYTEAETDQAGRFPGSRGLEGGMGIDERLPLAREHERRVAAEIACWLEGLLRDHPDAIWQCAAGPDLLHEVLARIDPGIRDHLVREIPKHLANLPLAELREHVPAFPP